MRPLLTLLPLFLACNSDKGITVFNSTPEATITSHSDGDSVLEGYTLVFRGSASDANHDYDELLATWYMDDEILCAATVPESDGAVLCEGVLTQSVSEITLEVKDSGNATGSTRISLSVIPTQAPEVEILQPISNGIFYSDQKITFSGVVSDNEDAAVDLHTHWSSDLDGLLTAVNATPNSAGAVEGFGYLSEGAHALQLHVEDSIGKTNSASVVVTVGPPNSAPDCEITQPLSGTGVAAGEEILFRGLASDVDVPAALLTVEWTSDMDGFLGDSTVNPNGSVSFPYAQLSANPHLISMTVRDELGTECLAEVGITVGSPPELSILSPSTSAVFNEGDAIAFEAMVSDLEDQPSAIALSWDVDGDLLSTQAPSVSGLASFLDATLGLGNHLLTVTATDTDGLSSTESLSFSVNGRPSAPIVSISPNPADTSHALTANASASVDPEGDAVSYSYQWLQNGQPTLYTTAEVPSSATSKHELWTVQVTPEDGMAQGPMTESSILIQNSPPLVSNVVVSPNQPGNSDALNCVYTVTDPDESPAVSVEWWNSTTGLNLGTGASLSLNPSMAVVYDSIECHVTASDSDGASHTEIASVTVSNATPVVSAVLITPSSANNRDILTCTAAASDGDGESLSYDHLWTNDTSGLSLGTGVSLTLDTTLAAPEDVIQCTVTVTDPNGASDSGTASLSLSNTHPTVSGVAILPNTAITTSSVLSCVATAGDLDGDVLTTSYAWYNGSALLGTGASLSLDSSIVGPSDVVSCVVSTEDPYGASVSDSATVVVDNSLPTVDAVSISPSAAVHGDALTCLASASDVDGDTPALAYAWTVNGLPAGNTASLSLSTAVDGDGVVCTVTASDAHGGSANGSASLIVDNTAPTITGLSIAPSSPTSQTAALSCTVTSSDVDTDPVSLSYEWVINGQTQAEQTSILTGPFAVSDVVLCRATPNDGKESGLAAETSVTVLNTDPTIDSIAISPNSGVSSVSTLECQVSHSDVDGDALNGVYLWTINGNSVGTASQLTLNPSMVSPGDDVICSVTVSDSHGGSDTDSAVVTVENSNPVFTVEAAISPNTGVLTGTVLNCSAAGSDVDGGNVTLSYAWWNGTQSIGSGPQLTVDPSNTDVGHTLSCVVTATDTDGGASQSAADVVVENTTPSLNSATVSPSSGITTSSVLMCSGTASDPDLESLSISYAWVNQTTGNTLGNSSTLSLTPQISSPGDVIQCVSTVTDPHGASDSTTLNLSVENTLPVVVSVAITPNTGVQQGDFVTCSAVSSDADSSAVTLSYEWKLNGLSVGTGAGLLLNTAVKDDVLECIATAVDADGGLASGSTSLLIDNTAPTVTSVTLSPSAPNSQTPYISCTASGSDVDNDALSFSYVWLVDGLTQSSTSSYLGGPFSIGAQITCRATPFDGIDSGPSMDASVSVDNLPPAVSSVTLSPSTVYTNDTITATAVMSDGDGQVVTAEYVWHVIDATSGVDSVVQVGSNHMLSGGLHFDRDDSVYVVVTPFDGMQNGSPAVSSALTVSNTAPGAPSVVISPSTPMMGQDDLLCSVVVSSADADMDAMRYTYLWIDPTGQVAQSTSLTSALSDVYPKYDTSEGDWSCKVIPHDGTESGPYAMATVFVESPCIYGYCHEHLPIGDGYGIDLVTIPAGSFEMGSPSSEFGRESNETLHPVTLTRDFIASTTEITQGMFEQLMGYAPYSGKSTVHTSFGSYGVGDDYPAYYVSWHMAAAFANAVTNQHNIEYGTSLQNCYACLGSGSTNVSCSVAVPDVYECSGYRLLTEAEWEYAARADVSAAIWTPFGGGELTSWSSSSFMLSDGSDLRDYGWYYAMFNIPYGSKAVASLMANDFHMFDMSGNVRELVHDSYVSSLGSSAVVDPVWEGGSSQVVRNGYWSDDPYQLRSAYRQSVSSTTRSNATGFRIGRTAP